MLAVLSKHENTHSRMYFTDGSKLYTKGHSGVGVYVQKKNIRASYALCWRATGFQMEVYAILPGGRRQHGEGSVKLL